MHINGKMLVGKIGATISHTMFLTGGLDDESRCKVGVPHSKSGLVPRSSLSGAGQLGFWEIGKGGRSG
jgi:hypothetical protein